jgi:hypothetical protein
MMQAKAAPVVSTPRINTFLAQVYLLMTVGLVITGFTASLVVGNKQFLLRLATSPWLAWGLFLIQIMVVVVLSGAVRRMAPGVAALLFLLYAALTGVTLSTLALYYTSENISQVFWVAAGTFFLYSMVGLISKRDMSAGGARSPCCCWGGCSPGSSVSCSRSRTSIGSSASQALRCSWG